MFSREINKQLYCPKCFTSSSRQKRCSLKFICRRLEFRCRNKIERETRLASFAADNGTQQQNRANIIKSAAARTHTHLYTGA
jgi:hypothetical protein